MEETQEFAGTVVFLVTLYSLLERSVPVLTVRRLAAAGDASSTGRPAQPDLREA